MAGSDEARGSAVTPLDADWEFALTPPGAWASPHDAGDGEWLPAIVPGTAAQALAALGRWSLDDPEPLHDKDVWYRLRLAGTGRKTLRFGGLATIAEVWLNGPRILSTEQMFKSHEVDVDLTVDNALHIAFRSLDRHLASVSGPRARWRTRMIPEQKLRLVRTTLLGHMPGWCPPVHIVGPWREIGLVDIAAGPTIRRTQIKAELDGNDGRLSVRLEIGKPLEPGIEPSLICEGVSAALTRSGPTELTGELVVPDVERWWPHTHGTPRLYAPKLVLRNLSSPASRVAAREGDPFAGTPRHGSPSLAATRLAGDDGHAILDLPKIGFRTLAVDRGVNGKGFALIVNGVKIFCRGATWTPDVVALPSSRASYARDLALVREAGVNMLRVGGTMAYEAAAFHELCDELGILIWQDAMFANFDYPGADEAFLASVRREIGDLFDRVGPSPSLAVFCGGSEVFQQAAMMGLPEKSRAHPLFDDILPAILAERRPDVAYVPSSPSGGTLPFVSDEGPSHYYGVGAYCRPLEDARRANVRFAVECLAFANLPDETMLSRHLPVPAVHDPRWKARVPRDLGASWDFEDVRDHYLADLYRVDPPRLRTEDPLRYRELSRAVTAEVMERIIDEWRRPGSVTAGALVWFWKDLWPGTGWGVVDSTGRPKSVWHALKRAFAPLRLIISDEGVNGLHLHAVNDGPVAISGTLSLRCLREGAVPVALGRQAVEVPAHSGISVSAFELFGAFFDAGYAYRFGPLPHDVVAAELTTGETLLAEAFHLMPPARNQRQALGLTATAGLDEDGPFLRLATERAALFVDIADEALEACDNGFHLMPGRDRVVRFRASAEGAPAPRGEIAAMNGVAPVRYAAERPSS